MKTKILKLATLKISACLNMQKLREEHDEAMNAINNKGNSTYSYRMFSVSQCRVNSRVVVFHTLHRGQRDTRLCPYFVFFTTLYPLMLSQLCGSSVLIPLLYSSIWSSSTFAVTAVFGLAPTRSSPACYHHSILTRAPCFYSVASHRSRIGCVSIYCVTVFCFRQM